MRRLFIIVSMLVFSSFTSPVWSVIIGATNTATNQNPPMPVQDIEITNIVAEGTACPGIGRLAMDTNGAPLFCQYGRWASVVTPDKAIPPGQVSHFHRTSAPPGWLVADGSDVSRTTYAALWEAMGHPNTGDGSTTFTLPDLRGYFLRGWDSGAGRDIGRGLYSTQDCQNRRHGHYVLACHFEDSIHLPNRGYRVALPGKRHDDFGKDPNVFPTWTNASTKFPSEDPDLGPTWINASAKFPSEVLEGRPQATEDLPTRAFYAMSDGEVESRPINVALLACIKY